MNTYKEELQISSKTLHSMYVSLMRNYKETKKETEELQNEINKLKNKNAELKDRCYVARENANQHAYLANKRKKIIEEKDTEIEVLKEILENKNNRNEELTKACNMYTKTIVLLQSIIDSGEINATKE